MTYLVFAVVVSFISAMNVQTTYAADRQLSCVVYDDLEYWAGRAARFDPDPRPYTRQLQNEAKDIRQAIRDLLYQNRDISALSAIRERVNRPLDGQAGETVAKKLPGYGNELRQVIDGLRRNQRGVISLDAYQNVMGGPRCGLPLPAFCIEYGISSPQLTAEKIWFLRHFLRNLGSTRAPLFHRISFTDGERAVWDLFVELVSSMRPFLEINRTPKQARQWTARWDEINKTIDDTYYLLSEKKEIERDSALRFMLDTCRFMADFLKLKIFDDAPVSLPLAGLQEAQILGLMHALEQYLAGHSAELPDFTPYTSFIAPEIIDRYYLCQARDDQEELTKSVRAIYDKLNELFIIVAFDRYRLSESYMNQI